MVAVVGGNSLGLGQGSLASLGQQGSWGAAGTGRSGEAAFVNAATGNLVLQHQDEFLAGRGGSAQSLRTYNSLGQFSDDNGDNWSLGYYSRQLKVIGTPNAAGSSVVRTDRDGAQASYEFVGTNAYRSYSGGGAYDTLTYNSGLGQWTWKDGASGATETYSHSTGRLLAASDPEGNTLSYGYSLEGLLTSVATANGDVTYYDYRNGNLDQVRTVYTDTDLQRRTLTRVRYGYDTRNRLETVTVDLTPDDNSVMDGKTYVTTYGYHGDSTRVRFVSQSDGSRLDIEYDEANRVSWVEDALRQRTSYHYEPLTRKTTITDPRGKATVVEYDDQGQILGVTGPTSGGAPARSVRFTYNSKGDVTSSVDGEGNATHFIYDERGNLLEERDAAGNTVTRRYDLNNQLTNEIRYLKPDPDSAGSQAASDPITTRYVYDANGKNRLRFVVGPEGRVIEHRYNSFGQRSATLLHASKVYSAVGSLAPTAVLTESQLQTWVGDATQDRTKIQLTEFAYDARGLLRASTTYAKVDAQGAGILNGEQSYVQFFYDQQGLLRSTISAKSEHSSYAYDGLGRLVASTDTKQQPTITTYDDANAKTVVKMANGLTSISSFDKAGRLIGVEQSSGTPLGETRYFYDPAGNLILSQDPTGVRNWGVYDDAGRKVAEIDGTGTLTEFKYDGNGKVRSAITYEQAVSTSGWLDVLGNPVALSLDGPNGIRPQSRLNDRTVSYRYDTANRLVELVDSSGATTVFTYDGASRKVMEKQLGRGAGAMGPQLPPRTTRYFYDKDSNLIAILDPAGYVTAQTFDAAGRVATRSRYAERTKADPSVWETANHWAITLGLGLHAKDIKETFEYNSKGQWVRHTDGENYVTTRTYDGNGNLRSESRAGSGEVQTKVWIHDELNRVKHFTDVDGTVTVYEYDIQGNLVSTTRALGQTDAMGGASTARTRLQRFDLQGRLTAELTAEGAALIRPGMSTSEVEAIWTQHAVKHSYDKAGRLTSTTDPFGRSTLFFYDADGRLTHRVNALGEVEEQRYSNFGQREASIRYGSHVDRSKFGPGGLVTTALTDALRALVNPSLDSTVQSLYNQQGLLAATIDPNGVRTHYEYGTFNELLFVKTATNAAGDLASTLRVDQYSYDRRGLNTSVIRNALGAANLIQTVSTKYDAFGRAYETIDGNGKVRKQDFDRLGRVVVVTDALLNKRSTTYDAFDRVLSQTNELEQTTTYSHSTANRSVTVMTPEGVTMTTVQNRHGQTLSVSDGKRNTTNYSYDLDGRLTGIATPLGGTSQKFDAAGRLEEARDARGTKVVYTFDGANRVLTRRLDPDGLNQLTTYEYDARGNQVSVVDAHGTRTVTVYNLADQVLTQTVDPIDAGNPNGLNLATRYEYTELGKVLRVTDPRGNVTEYGYDALGRRIRETVDPTGLNIRTTYIYDQNDNVVAKTDAASGITHYVYDAENRLLVTVDPAGGVSRLEYDRAGRVTRSTRYASVLYGYKALTIPATLYSVTSSNVLNRKVGLDAVEARVYDRDGRVRFLVDGNGAVTKFLPDENGNVIEQRAYANRIDLSVWDGVSNPVVEPDDARDRILRTSYDTLNRVTHRADALGYVTEWQYDANGNVLRQIQHAAKIGATDKASDVPIQAGQRTTVFEYDRANRETWRSDAVGAVTRTQYDDIANTRTVTSYATQLVPGQQPSTLAQQGAGPSDRVTKTYFDKANRRQFSLDALNFVTRYQYDKNGNVEVLTRHAAALGSGLHPNQVVNNSALDRSDRYVYDAANRVSSHTDSEGGIESYTYDGLGNNKTYTNQKGSVWAYDYDAAGRLIQETSPQVVMTRVSGDYTAMTKLGDDVAALVTRLEYDALGQLTKRTEAHGRGEARTTQYVYDARGHQTKVIFPMVWIYNESLSELAANGLNNSAVRKEREVTPQTQTFYDAFGNAVANIDTAGAVSYKVYDRAGRACYEIDALGQVTGYRRNAFGEAEDTVRYAGATTLSAATPSSAAQAPKEGDVQVALAAASPGQRLLSVEYDALGRAIKVKEPPATSYDSSSGLTTAGARKETNNRFNAFGELIQSRQGAENGPPLAITTHYFDRLSREIQTVDALGYVTRRDFDSRGNLSRLSEYARPLATGTPDPTGLPSLPQASGTDRHTEFGHDRLDRKTSQTRLGVQVSQAQGGGVQEVRRDLATTYGYDAVGNLTRTTDPVGASVYSYYDALGRVTAVVTPENQGEAAAVKGLTIFWRDTLGNVVMKEERANGAVSAGEFVGVSTLASPGFVAGVADAANDRLTRTRYDRLGRVVQVMDAENKSSATSYNERGDVAKAWRTVTLASGSLRTLFQAFAYDKLGRLTHTYEPAPYAGLLATGALVDTALEYNSYGDLTGKLVNGERTEFFDYDTAGRLWRTNSGDGATRILLSDVLGRTTSEIRSATLDLRSVSLDDAYNTALNNLESLRRTDSVYDAMGRLVEQRQPIRLEQQGGVSAQRQYLSITGQSSMNWQEGSIQPLSLALDAAPTALQGVGGSWSGSNTVSLSWAPLGELGSGEVKVELSYETLDLGALGIHPRTETLTRTFSTEEANAGVTLNWNNSTADSGGLDRIHSVKVFKKDVNGVWREINKNGDGGFSGNFVAVKMPDDPGVAVTVAYRLKSSAPNGAWTDISTSGINFGWTRWYDASGMEPGVYEYTVKTQRAGESAVATVSAGDLILASPSVARIAATVAYGQGGAPAGTLSWASPPSGTLQALRYRVAGSNGEWTLATLSTQGGFYTGFDVTSLGSGSYQYELIWSNQFNEVQSHATGTFQYVAATPPINIPAVGVPQLQNIVVNATGELVNGTRTINAELLWNDGPSGAVATVWLRKSGEPNFVQSQAPIASVNGRSRIEFKGVEANVAYQFEIRYTDTNTQRVALGTGTATFAPYVAPITPDPSLSNTEVAMVAGFSVDTSQKTLNWVSTSAGAASFEYRLLGSGNAWATLDVTQSGSNAKVGYAALGAGVYEFKVSYLNSGITLALGAGKVTVYAATQTPRDPLIDGVAPARITVFHPTSSTLSWAKPSNTTAFFEYRVAGSNDWLRLSVGDSGSSWVNISNLAPNTYDYRVSHVSTDGNTLVAVGIGRLQINAPPNVRVTSALIPTSSAVVPSFSSDGKTLRWLRPSNGAAVYEQRTTPSGIWTPITITPAGDYDTVPVLGLSGAFEFRVAYKDGNQNATLGRGTITLHAGNVGWPAPNATTQVGGFSVLNRRLRWTPPSGGGTVDLFSRAGSSGPWTSAGTALANPYYDIPSNLSGTHEFRVVYRSGGLNLDIRAEGQVQLNLQPLSTIQANPTNRVSTITDVSVSNGRMSWPRMDGTVSLEYRAGSSGSWTLYEPVSSITLENSRHGISLSGLSGDYEFRIAYKESDGAMVSFGASVLRYSGGSYSVELSKLPESEPGLAAITGETQLSWVRPPVTTFGPISGGGTVFYRKEGNSGWTSAGVVLGVPSGRDSFDFGSLTSSPGTYDIRIEYKNAAGKVIGFGRGKVDVRAKSSAQGSQVTSLTSAQIQTTPNQVSWVPITASSVVYYRRVGDSGWTLGGVAGVDAQTNRQFADLRNLTEVNYEYRIHHHDGAGGQGAMVGLTTGTFTRTLQNPAVAPLTEASVSGLGSNADQFYWNPGPAGTVTTRLYARALNYAGAFELQTISYEGGKWVYRVPTNVPAGAQYEYLIQHTDANGKVLSLGRGSLTVQGWTQGAATPPSYNASTAVNVGSFSATPTELSWAVPNSGWTATFEGRPLTASQDQPWTPFAPSAVLNNRQSISLVGVNPGPYEFRVVYRLGTEVKAMGAGKITVYAPNTTQQAPDVAIMNTAVTGWGINPTALKWNDVAGSTPYLRVRKVGTGTWPAPLAVARANGFASFDLSTLSERTSYEFELIYRAGTNNPNGAITALDSGTFTLHPTTAGYQPAPSFGITTPPYTPPSVVPGTPAQFGHADTTAQNPQVISLAASQLGYTLSVVGGNDPLLLQARPVIKNEVDRWGNVLSTTDPRNAAWKTSFSWNHDNQLITQVRPNTAVRDQNGAVSAAAPTTRFYYDAAGRRIGVRDENGNLNQEAFDAVGNRIEERHADGGVVTHRFNAFGQEVLLRNAEGNRAGAAAVVAAQTTRYVYDRLGRLTSTTRASVPVYSVKDNGNSKTPALILQGGTTQAITERFAYDEAGRLTKQWDGANMLTAYIHDAGGRVLWRQRGSDVTTTYAYNAYGHKIQETDGNSLSMSWATDAFGRTLSHTDLGGRTTVTEYNFAKQVARESQGTRGAGFETLYSYDRAGQLVRIQEKSGYLENGQQKQREHVTSYAYDLAGNRVLERTRVDGLLYQDNHLGYDELGRLRSVADARVSALFHYDLAGNRTRIQIHYVDATGADLQNQDRSFRYDAMNRVTLSDGDANGNLVKGSHRVQYDLNGNRISDIFIGTAVTANGSGGYQQVADVEVQELYRYDGLNRLAQVERGGVVVDERLYDAAGRVVFSGPRSLPTGYARALNQNQPLAEAIGLEQRFNLYGATGRLERQDVADSQGSRKYEVWNKDSRSGGSFNGYDAAGNQTQYDIWQAGQKTTHRVTLARFDSYTQQSVQISGSSGNATSTSSYDARGNLIAVKDGGQSANDRSFVNDAQGRALFVNQAGNVQRQLIVNGEVLGRFGVGVAPARLQNENSNVGRNVRFEELAEFNFGYQAINGAYPGASPGQYTVRQGDTLESIARGAYGDAKLWYRIAEANGLMGSSELRAGQSLSIPTGVSGTHNTSENFKPYDPSGVIGNASPTLPTPGNQQKCGLLPIIVQAIVTVVVTVMTNGNVAAGAAAGDASRQYSRAALDGQLDYKDLLLAGGARNLEFGLLSPLSYGLLGPSLGHLPLKSYYERPPGFTKERTYDYKSTALAAVSAYVGQQYASAGLAQRMAAGAAINGGATAAMQVASGTWNWREIVASATSGAVAPMASSALSGNYVGSGFVSSLGGSMAGSLASSAVKGYDSRQRKAAMQQAMASGFGNAIGESVAGAMQSGSDQGANNRTLLNAAERSADPSRYSTSGMAFAASVAASRAQGPADSGVSWVEDWRDRQAGISVMPAQAPTTGGFLGGWMPSYELPVPGINTREPFLGYLAPDGTGHGNPQAPVEVTAQRAPTDFVTGFKEKAGETASSVWGGLRGFGLDTWDGWHGVRGTRSGFYRNVDDMGLGKTLLYYGVQGTLAPWMTAGAIVDSGGRTAVNLAKGDMGAAGRSTASLLGNTSMAAFTVLGGRVGVNGRTSFASPGWTSVAADFVPGNAVRTSVEGTASLHQTTHLWTANPGGPRSMAEARAIAENNGAYIADDVHFISVGDTLYDSKFGNSYATYGRFSVSDLSAPVMWKAPSVTSGGIADSTGRINVWIRQSVLDSDQAITAVLAHETFEIEALRPMFQQNGGALPASIYARQVRPNVPNNIHWKAVDFGDQLVRDMLNLGGK